MTMPIVERPFRFSLQEARADSRRQWVDLVKRVDDAGFDMLVTADHLHECLAPLIPLVTAAEVSDRLRLGVMVLNNDFLHPALLAREVATLDLLSDGRAELGIGAGHAKPEYDAAGLPFDAASTRVDRLEEAVQLLVRLLAGESVTHSGTHYDLAEARCSPLPVQRPLPMLVGGTGRRVHRIAARHADAVGFTGLQIHADGRGAEPARFGSRFVDEDVEALRTAAGARLPDLELQVLVQMVVVTDDPVGAADEIRRQHFASLDVDHVLDTPYLMVGTVDGLVEKLLRQRARWGFCHYTVRKEALGHLDPVIAELAGR